MNLPGFDFVNNAINRIRSITLRDDKRYVVKAVEFDGCHDRFKSDAVLLLCNKDMDVFHGSFSQSIHEKFGETLKTSVAQLKETYVMDQELRRGEAVFLETNKHKGNIIAEKLLIFGRYDSTLKMRPVDEQSLRLVYLYAFSWAAMHQCTSIELPTVNSSTICNKTYCRLMLQTIGMFLKMSPSTSLNCFSIVCYSGSEVSYFNKKLKGNAGIPKKLNFFVEMKKEVEKNTIDRLAITTVTRQKHRFFNDITMKEKRSLFGTRNAKKEAKAISKQSWKAFTHFQKYTNQNAFEIDVNQSDQSEQSEEESCRISWKGGCDGYDDEDQEQDEPSAKRAKDENDRDVITTEHSTSTESSTIRPKFFEAKKRKRLNKLAFAKAASASAAAKRNSPANNMRMLDDSLDELRTQSSLSTGRPNRPEPTVNTPITPSQASIISPVNFSRAETLPMMEVDTSFDEALSTLSTPRYNLRDVGYRSTKATPTLSPLEINSPPNVVSFEETPKTRRKQDETVSTKKRNIRLRCQKAKNQRDLFKRNFAYDPDKLEELETLIPATELLRGFMVSEVDLIREHIKKQLTFDVAGPIGMSENERKKRQLCRIGVHCGLDQNDGKHYEPLTTVFPPIWRKFMGYVNVAAKETDQNEDVKMEEDGSDDEEAMDREAATEAIPARPDQIQTIVDIPDDNRDIQNQLSDLFGPAVVPELEQDVPEEGQFVKALLCQITYARACDEDCPAIDVEEAGAVHYRLTQWLYEGEVDTFKLEELKYEYEMETRAVYQWLKRYEKCYQGIRSLNKRFQEFGLLFDLIALSDHAINFKNVAILKELMKLDDLPSPLRSKFERFYLIPKDQHHHTQAYAKNKFKANIDGFRNEMDQLETTECDICSMLTALSSLKSLKKEDYPQVLTTKTRLLNRSLLACPLCQAALGSTRRGDLPACALNNNLTPADVPVELSELGVLELLIIERARANMKIAFLRNIANQKTPMRSMKGAMLVLPTEVEATVDHVIDTLPSGSNLNIQVRKQWQKEYLVRMPYVIRALKWLKANNSNYADIQINDDFTFEINKDIFFEDPNATQDDVEAMILRGDDEDETDKDKVSDDHLLTHDDCEMIPMKRMRELNTNELPHVQYSLKRHQYTPIPVETKDIDTKIFILEHPHGNDGLDAPREKSLSTPAYIRSRLLGKDRRWAQNPQWLCFMFGRKQQINMTNVQGFQARVNHGTTSQQFDLNDERTQKTISAAYAKTRGYPQYWQSVKYCLRAHVATHGAPTWFLTLNPNTKGWKDLHILYSKILGCDVDENNIDDKIALDPTIFARYWRHRIRAFFRHLISGAGSPLGKVTHFFKRIEYQHRGTQHEHCLLWTADKPALNAKSSELAAFIDKHVCARLPDPEKEKELYDVIVNQQSHWKEHGATCQRVYRSKTGLRSTKCRFGYPRPALRRTTVMMEQKRIAGLNNRSYSLQRTTEEVLVNDYNTAFTLAWGASTDLSFVHGESKSVVSYITSYLSKNDISKQLDRMDPDDFHSVNKNELLFKIGYDINDRRESGLLEICDELLGHKLFEFDQSHQFIPSDNIDKRMRVLKPKSRLKADDDVVYVTNFLDDYYPHRPESLSSCSVYNVITNFEIVTPVSNSKTRRNRPIDDNDDRRKNTKTDGGDKKKKKKKRNVDGSDEYKNSDNEESSDDDDERVVHDGRYHPDDPHSIFYSHPYMESGDKLPIVGMNHNVFRKIKQKVGRFFLPKLNVEDVDSIEDFYRRLVLIFVPWRVENDTIQMYGADTFFETWKAHLEELKKMSDTSAYEDLVTLVGGYIRLQEEEEAEMGRRLDRERKVRETLEIDEETEETFEMQNRHVDEEKHEKNKSNLNRTQREIFEEVMARLAQQSAVSDENESIKEKNKELVRNKQSRLPLNPLPEPIKMFVSGPAGTGKSFLINTLADEITLQYSISGVTRTTGLRPPVILCAPTGIAAISISGNTIHSLLGIEVVQAGRRAEEAFTPLNDAKKYELRHLFSNVKLVIVDEVSMVSNILLMKMSLRLQEISGSTEPFGRFNMLFFGDLLQLAPVKAPQPFKAIASSLQRRIFGSVHTHINLWSLLSYKELRNNMRQGDSLELAQLFERVRSGSHTEKDLDVFRARRIESSSDDQDPTMEEIASFVVDMQRKDPTSMALFGKNEEVDVMNKLVMEKMKAASFTINAVDSIDSESSDRIRKANSNSKRRPYQSLSIKAVKDPKVGERNQMTFDSIAHQGASACDNQMHGGLTPSLTVAVGSRVMLRRNLCISDRLVNGATGVVTEIQTVSVPFSPNVPKVSVEVIFVRFDGGHPAEPYPIKPVTVTFQKRNEIMTRRQFPLVLAYAATIHKAQGLTLRNVLIRPRQIFANGQFYVAVSRVTQLEGLHLAGFNSDILLTDGDAFDESNRLRDLINIPRLVKGALWKTRNSSLLMKNRTQLHEATDVTLQKQRMAYKSSVAIKDGLLNSKIISKKNPLKIRSLLLLRGGDDSVVDTCLSAAVNMFFNCRQFCDRLRDFPDVEELSECLQNIFNREEDNVTLLKECLASNWYLEHFEDVGQESRWMFETISSMLTKLAIEEFELNEPLKVEIKRMLKCSTDGCVSSCENSSHTCTVLQMPSTVNTIRVEFQELFDSQLNVRHTVKCTKCQNGTLVDCTIRETMSKHHLVLLDKSTDSATFTDFKVNTTVRMFGTRWILNSFSSEQTIVKNSIQEKRFLSWARQGDDFVAVVGNECIARVTSDSLNLNMFVVSALVFERMGAFIEESDDDEEEDKKDEWTHVNKTTYVPIPASPSPLSPPSQHQQQQQKKKTKSVSTSKQFTLPKPPKSPLYSIQLSKEDCLLANKDQNKVNNGLLILNAGNTCFLNVAVNLFYSCVTFREKLQQPSTHLKTACGRVLQQLFDPAIRYNSEKKIEAILALVAILPAKFRNGEEHDINDAINAIFELLEGEDSLLETITVLLNRKCDNPNCSGREIFQIFERSALLMPSSTQSLSTLFQQSGEYVPVKMCEDCNSGWKINDVTTPEYHIVLIDRSVDAFFTEAKIDDIVEMCGYEWTVVSMAQYLTVDRGAHGHYRTVVQEKNDDWVMMSDGRIVKRLKNADFNLSRTMVNALVLKRR